MLIVAKIWQLRCKAVLAVFLTVQSTGVAQNPSVAEPLDGREGRELLLKNFRPKMQLEVAEHLRIKAAFPVVDVHTHFFYKLRSSQQALDDYVAIMNRNRIAVSVSLDGSLNGRLEEHVKFLWSKYKDRFVIFANVDWRGDGIEENPASWACHRAGFAERTAQELAVAVESGVSGLKLFKRFGLEYKNPDGSLIKVDDARFDPIWQAC